MDLDALLKPLTEAAPCGDDLSFSDEFDTIAELRREDDASLPLGEWKEKGKEPKVADWPGVAALCERLLRERAKDLRLVGWLAEACAHQHGFAGLAEGLALAAALLEQHWDSVHPQPDDGDHELRIGSLSWLLGRVAPLARLLQQASGTAPSRAELDSALQALARLQQAVDARLGAEGPGFVAAREALRAVRADLPAEAGGEAPGAAVPPVAGEATGAGSSPAGGPLQTRAQALQQLRQVAEYFRRTEPHSPVAYLADKAARWGAMDLHGWLRTVVKDGASLAHLEELLGVEPPRAG